MASEKLARQPNVTIKHCLVVLAALLVLMHYFAFPHISNVKKETPQNGIAENLLLPLNIHIRNEGAGPQTYYIEIQYKEGQQTKFYIHTQGCMNRLTINGFPVVFPLNKGCNFAKGMAIELERHLLPGTNNVRIDTQTPGVAIGPVTFSGKLALSDILGSLVVAVSCILMILFLRKHTKDYLSGFILAASFILCVYVMTHTTFMWKKYDLPQHLEYITYIANNLKLPSTYQGFLTYHPPLYYTVQAVLLGVTNWLASFNTLESIRVFNMIFFLGSSIFSMLTLRRIIKHNLAYYTSIAFLLFYPGGIVASARIDSDLLFYTFFSGTLYFLLRWVQTAKTRKCAWALIMCGLAIATRTNALVLLPLFGLAGLYVWYKHSFTVLWSHRKSVAVTIGIIILLLGAVVNFGRPAYENIMMHRNQEYIVGNADYLASIARSLRVPNQLKHYLHFNTQEYFNPPFFNVWSNRGGRLFFWNTVLKSSMFGEFSYPNAIIAYYLNWVLLCLVLFVPFSMLCEIPRLKKQPEWLMMLFALFIPIMGLAANRILHPIACSQDFRYVYPAIAAFCGLVGFSIQQHLYDRRRAIIAIAGIALVICFVTLSLLFFLKMH